MQLVHERSATAVQIQVNLQARECSCGKWQQFKVPCQCALLVLTTLRPTEHIFTENYFGAMHFTRRWQAMYTIAISTADAEINTVWRQNNCQRFTAILVVDQTSTLSAKRINSTGDSGHSRSTITSSFSKKQKIECELCGKMLSPKTEHPPSACASFAMLNNRAVAVPQIPTIPSDNELSTDATEEHVYEQLPDVIENEFMPISTTSHNTAFTSHFSWVPARIAFMFTASK